MDIPMKATVECDGQDCGQVTCLVVNPRNDELSHIVVEENTEPHKERIIPVELIESSSAKTIRLACSPEEFVKMDDFIEHHYIPAEQGYGVFPLRQKVYIPYTTFGKKMADITRERIPTGAITFHPGSRIEAVDGEVGIVDEFLIDPASEHITHLVAQTGHLWNKKEVAIPASQIERVEKDVIYLKLHRNQVANFPTPASLMQEAPA